MRSMCNPRSPISDLLKMSQWYGGTANHPKAAGTTETESAGTTESESAGTTEALPLKGSLSSPWKSLILSISFKFLISPKKIYIKKLDPKWVPERAKHGGRKI